MKGEAHSGDSEASEAQDDPRHRPGLPARASVSRPQRLLWQIGGFDPEVLSAPECRTIRAKYSTMGVLILVTAALSSCSAGYALDTVFHNGYLTLAMSLLWGTTVLSLDRFLVSSTRKNARPRDYKAEPHKLPPYIAQIPWLSLCARLPVAIAIGLVVAKPIESRIMQPWIRAYERSQADARRAAVEGSPELVRLRHGIEEDEERRDTKAAEVERKRIDAACESDGTCGSGRLGARRIWEIKEDYYRAALGEFNTIVSDLDSKRREYAAERARQMTLAEHDVTANESERSIVDDLEGIDAISVADDTKGRTVWKVSTFLTLLFVLIECLPVLAKAISPFDPYDAALQESEHGSILDSLAGARRRYVLASLSE
jgi:hypothetical protein